jgi:hypothetical protein
MFVFENYPVGVSNETQRNLGIQSAEVKDGTHYPISLIAANRSSLSLRLVFDRECIDQEYAQTILNRLIGLLSNF